VALRVVESKAKYLQETEESVELGVEQNKVFTKAGDSVLSEAETQGLGVPNEGETEEIIKGEMLTFGEYQNKEIAVEAERVTVAKVTAEDDVALAVVEVKVESLVDVNEILMGEEDMALNVKAKGETVEELIAEKDVALTLGEVTEAPESINRRKEEIPQIVVEEVPVQSQEKRSKEKMESGMVEEKVGDLTEPEQRPAEEQVGLYQRESKELASAGTIDKMERMK